MQTAARELQEETGLDGLALIEVATFDALGRDPRGCFISTAFLALVPDHVDLAPKAADDAKEAQWFPLSALPTLPLAFDHTQIVRCTLAQPFARLLQSGVQL